MLSDHLHDEFRVHHRAASESILRAVAATDYKVINEELDRADYFEKTAMQFITGPRQRALTIGLMHTVDLMRAVTDAEFIYRPPGEHRE
jgi:hypothetical protein